MYEVLHLDSSISDAVEFQVENLMQRRRPARYARRHPGNPERPGPTVIDVPLGVPLSVAGSSLQCMFRWSCEQCGAKGETIFRVASNINFISAAGDHPEVKAIPLRFLPAPSEGLSIATAHCRLSPQCSAWPIIDLRPAGDAKPPEVAGDSPAQRSGGTA
jgi:hypothetical protein